MAKRLSNHPIQKHSRHSIMAGRMGVQRDNVPLALSAQDRGAGAAPLPAKKGLPQEAPPQAKPFVRFILNRP